jgi:hypothetical protein
MKPRRYATRRGNGALHAPGMVENLCSERNPAAPSRSWHRARHRHGLARARPDSPTFRPLHSATRTALQAPRTFRCVPTVANCRDRREGRALHNGLTPRPSVSAPGYIPPLWPVRHAPRHSARWQVQAPRSQHKPRSRWRDSPKRTPATRN